MSKQATMQTRVIAAGGIERPPDAALAGVPGLITQMIVGRMHDWGKAVLERSARGIIAGEGSAETTVFSFDRPTDSVALVRFGYRLSSDTEPPYVEAAALLMPGLDLAEKSSLIAYCEADPAFADLAEALPPLRSLRDGLELVMLLLTQKATNDPNVHAASVAFAHFHKNSLGLA